MAWEYDFDEVEISHNQYYAAFIAGGVGIAMGIAMGWMNSPVKRTEGDLGFKTANVFSSIIQLSDWYWHANVGFKLTVIEYSLVMSSLNIGAVFACIPSGFLVDAIGRKALLLMLFFPYICGWLFVLAASDAILLGLGRAIIGIAAAASSVVGPVYMFEVAHIKSRGIISAFFKLEITMGVLFVSTIELFLTTLGVTLACVLMNFLIFLPMIWIPETPLFLAWSNQRGEAMKSLRKLRGKHYDFTTELQEIDQNLIKMRAFEFKPDSFLKIVRRRESLKALFISLGLVCLLQLSGVNIFVSCSTMIFGYTKHSLDPRISTVIISSIQFLATLFSIPLIDKFGRRLLLLISIALIFMCLMALGIYFHLMQKMISLYQTLSWAPLTLMSITMLSYALGIGTVPWLMISELFPANLRGPATAIAITFYWFFGGLVVVGVIIVKNTVGAAEAFWTMGCSTLFGFIFVYFCVPETRNKKSAEILEMLSTKKLWEMSRKIQK